MASERKCGTSAWRLRVRVRESATVNTMIDASQLVASECSPSDPDALALIAALSRELQQITGSDGTANFRAEEIEQARAVFVVLRAGEFAVGCGSLRPLSATVCEIKRMYSTVRERGIGARLLQELESRAALLGFEQIWLETRRVNTRALAFYQRNGYCVRPNYGVYLGREEAICFQKQVSTG
jgi:putative acetyltransferase